MNKPFFTIGVMCYNEEGSIERVVKNVFEELGELAQLQVLIVDDGSTDKSVELVKNMQAQYDVLDLIAKPENVGIGGTLSSIYTQAKGEYVVAIPGDGQFDICELIPFLGFKKGEFVISNSKTAEMCKAFSDFFIKIGSADRWVKFNFLSVFTSEYDKYDHAKALVRLDKHLATIKAMGDPKYAQDYIRKNIFS